MTGVIINEGCLYNESCSTRAMLSSDFTLTLALITLTFESLFYSFIPYFCSQWLNVPHFYCLKEHLEDKHLRQILLDAETSTFYDRPETDPPSGQGAKK